MDKVLFDTSCVYAAIDPSLEPTVSSQLPTQNKTCQYYTSPYLRMEFFRRWIVTGIDIYLRTRITRDINETFHYFSHRFSHRDTKIALQWACRYMKSIQADPPTEPIERFGWEIYKFAQIYDSLFNRFINKTGCKRGQVSLDPDAQTRTEALKDFRQRFMLSDHNCKLESLLNLSGGSPSTKAILQASAHAFPKQSRKALRGFQKKLKDLLATCETPTCENCYHIGDVLIALEQKPSWVLYHTDHSFSALCPLLKRKHKFIDCLYKTSPNIP